MAALDSLKLTTDLKPTIVVKNPSPECYREAILKARTAMREKMHNIVDYYCEQMQLLDRFAAKADSREMDADMFWGELFNYVMLDFTEHTTIFQKVVGTNHFDCYSILMDYDAMQLPWPDGYKEPAQRIDGLAPIGLNDNYFFYAECNIMYRLDFGSCGCRESKLETDGASFNKRLEKVAIRNHQVAKALPFCSLLRSALEKLIRAKHGNDPTDTMSVVEILDSFSQFLKSTPNLRNFTVQILKEIDTTQVHFPQRFAIFEGDKQLMLEEFVDCL